MSYFIFLVSLIAGAWVAAQFDLGFTGGLVAAGGFYAGYAFVVNEHRDRLNRRAVRDALEEYRDA